MVKKNQKKLEELANKWPRSVTGKRREPLPEDDHGEHWGEPDMPNNVNELERTLVGQRIVSAVFVDNRNTLELTVSDGRRVRLEAQSDCCAYTEVEAFVFNPDKIDHIITEVKTEDGYETWHILADYEDILTLTVGWHAGTGYYTYGLSIKVIYPE